MRYGPGPHPPAFLPACTLPLSRFASKDEAEQFFHERVCSGHAGGVGYCGRGCAVGGSGHAVWVHGGAAVTLLLLLLLLGSPADA